MRCLVNHARKQTSAAQVSSNRPLERAAGHKASDVMRCGLSHTACGRPPDAYARRFGYVGGSYQWGETLAAEPGKDGSARQVMKAWLGSSGHRATILRSSFDDLGIGLKRGNFAGRSNVAVWTLNLGCHGC